MTAPSFARAESGADVLHGPHMPELLRHEVLADLFEATAQRCPDTIALISGNTSHTYRELNALADTAASHLLAAGIGGGDMVGLWLPRGLPLLVMQLAIAKTGAAWP